MNADISKELPENGTYDAFPKMQKRQVHQKEVTVKCSAVKQNATSQENDCKKLRRSYRSRVKPLRFEPEEIKIGTRCKKKFTQRRKIIYECFGSDSESDDDAFAKKDNPVRNGKVPHQDINVKSKKKKRKSRKRDSTGKIENKLNTFNLPYLKNDPKRKAIVDSELRRSNRTPVKPRRFEPDSIKSAQKINKIRVGDKAKRDSMSAKRNCEQAAGQSEINSKIEVPLKLEDKESKKNMLTKEKHQLLTSNKNVSISPKPRLKTISAKKNLNISKYVYPSSEEIAEIKRRESEQMRTNREMKAILKGLIRVPEKVKILSLNSMTADQILNTFPKYKAKLDTIFRELCSEPNVTGHNGINHFSVIELIDNVKQLKMMHKLGEVYEADHDGVSMYPMLFANALMPEWLVYIFKDKYNLSYSEAVTHLDKQRQYMQYMAVEDHH